VRGAVVAYANDVKTALLNVDPAALERYGAVSTEVAEAMATGVARGLGADLGLAITGVAGPGSEGTEKPVGLIFVAGWLGNAVEVVELHETGDRETNRAAAVAAALALAERMAEGP
jgi:PncC family amidohydrolase